MTDEQPKYNPADHLRPHQFKPGQSGNPGGKPKGAVSLKEYARKMLRELTEEEKLEFMKGLDKDKVWEMAEGRPAQETDITSGGEALQPILVKFLDGTTNNNRDTE